LTRAANKRTNPKQSARAAHTLAQFKAASSISEVVSLQSSPPLKLYLYNPRVNFLPSPKPSPNSKNSQLETRRMLQMTINREMRERKKGNGD
jgi:hypothetical protein